MKFPFIKSKISSSSEGKIYTPLELRKRGGKMLLASYDSAQTTGRNAKHWQWSDSLSADASNSKDVRKIIRERSRYEFNNNSYCHGMVQTLANGVVGTGPVLQMRTQDEGLNKAVEEIYEIHCKAIKFAQKLRVMKKAKTYDGESFAQFATREIKESPLTLDILSLECDRITDPSFTFLSAVRDKNIDGVIIDDYGCPVSYKVLRHHPGDNIISKLRDMFTADTINAENIIHWYRTDRAEQHRGICEYQAAMPLFSILRDYTMATLTAAQQSALLATVIQSTNTPEDSTNPNAEREIDAPEPMDTFALEQGMTTVLPEGYSLSQMKAEQPTSTFTDFEKAILRQIARTLNIPFNVAAGDSSGYNYASGRLDHQDFFRFLQVERKDMSLHVLDRFFTEFLKELSFLSDFRRWRSELLPVKYGKKSLPNHDWYFEDYKHVDPAKEAVAFERLLKNNGTSLADWYAGKGKDWRKELAQIKEEKELQKKYGITIDDITQSQKPLNTEKTNGQK